MNRSAHSPLAAALVVFCAGNLIALRAIADQPSGSEIAFFENRIRPVLVQHCYECHSLGAEDLDAEDLDAEDLGGQLRLDDRDALRRGGESGPAVVPGDPSASLVLQALRYDGIEMPPDAPLRPTVIADFERWIAGGAADPRRSESESVETNVSADRLWSLQAVAEPLPPRVQDRDWPLRSLDQFVLARMEESEVIPSRQADPKTLLRRLYFDLIGLPPTFDQVQRFATAAAVDYQQAVERLVDELLASDQFGQRWGRHWLDIARFAESNGNDGLGRNPAFPHAWRYRDYVIESFNRDLPYDRFLIEQIAGDLLTADSPVQADRHKIATGFLALASKPAKAMNNNFEMDVVADQIDAIGLGVMGLSVGCARCHDHKFDPIPTKDYYALAGIFTSTETMWGLAGNEKLTAPPTDLHVLEAAPENPPPEDFVETVILRESNTGKPKALPKPKWKRGTPLAMGVRDRDQPSDCKINVKGDAKKLATSVPRGFLSAVRFDDGTSESSPFVIPSKQSGRLELAQWLIDPRHPLTARVMVNRIWTHLFGQGLVRTPDDFGVYGQRPTHPLLLDHLARRFMNGGWSIKRLIREIVTSRTYQLTSLVDERQTESDPENLLLTRHLRRRLDAESLRDAMLVASGQMDDSPAEGSIVQHRDILVNLADNLHRPSNHRSVYLCYLRNSPPPELAAFDLPDFKTVIGQRATATVPAQLLHLLNSPFVIDQSHHLGRRIMTAVQDDRERIALAYRQVLHRQPRTTEMAAALELVRSNAGELECDEKAWSTLCQALLMTNEFRYVD